MKHYDFIFAGSGLSTLMTVYRMAASGKFSGKSILLIDKNSKKQNDRTWCFWEQPKGEWDEIVSAEWNSALFVNEGFKRELHLEPYQYKMIRGIDFYNFALSELSKHQNISFIKGEIADFSDTGNIVSIKTNAGEFTCNKLFNSIFNPSLPSSQSKYPILQQHFIGWKIKTKQAVFSTKVATFMDFSIPQKGNTRFMYVLPFSETEALIEYTLFSETLLPEQEYEEAIQEYISGLKISDFEILEKERGSIPMTSYPFWKNNTKNILNIGSAGGWTKASTGYTFKNTTKKSAELVSFLLDKDDFRQFQKTSRFNIYDVVLLDILAKDNHLGSEIFSSLFKKGKPSLILKFLDEETSLAEDLQVVFKCPKRLFASAALRRIFR
jgi:lycopene beta-cyclase